MNSSTLSDGHLWNQGAVLVMISRVLIVSVLWMISAALFLPVVSGSGSSGDTSGIDTARIWIKKADGFTESGMYDQALSAYDSAINASPLFAEGWSGKARVLSRLGRYRESLSLLDQTLMLDPGDSSAWFTRGQVHQALQQYEEAKADLNKSLWISPNNSRVLVTQGQVLISLDDAAAALSAFDDAIQINPGDGTAYAGKGEALYRLSSLSEAENITQVALTLDSVNMRAWQVMAAIARVQGNEERAAYYDDTAGDIARYGVTMPLYAKGLSLQRLNRYEDALAVYDHAVMEYPDEWVILVGRGETLKGLGRFDEALKSFEQAVQLKPLDSDIRQQRDMIKGMAGNTDHLHEMVVS